jgi:hypothetical protein
MQDFKRWTVRNVDPETIEIINLMRVSSGMTAGELLDEAVSDWYENLEEDDEEVEVENQ